MITKNIAFGVFIVFLSTSAFGASPEEKTRAAAMLAAAKTPEEKGFAIAKELDNRRQGAGTWTVDGKVVTKNRNGEERAQEYRVFQKDGPIKGDKLLLIFDKPDDVQGTASLLLTYKDDRPDDFWFYIPAIRRVKRISSQNRQGSFFGTEFTNEDSYLGEAEHFKYKWIRDEECEGKMCYVVERYPYVDPSAYKKWIMWIEKEEFLIHKWHIINKRDEHVKTFYIKDYQYYIDEFWWQDQQYIINHQTGKSSYVYFTNWKFRVDLKDSLFTVGGLKRLR
jgi:hypothetical protein